MPFQYRRPDASTYDEGANKSANSFDTAFKSQFPTFKPKKGQEYTVRILPPTWEDNERGSPVMYLSWHRSIGINNGTYSCLAQRGEPCPICEERRNTNDEEYSKKLKPSMRAVYWVIDRAKISDGPKIWSPGLEFHNILSTKTKKRTGELIFYNDPDEGNDIFFKMEDIQYTKPDKGTIEIYESSPISDDTRLQEKWLTYISNNPLPSTIDWRDYDSLQKILFGKTVTKSESTSIPRQERTVESVKEPLRSLDKIDVPTNVNKNTGEVIDENSDFDEDDLKPVSRRG